MTRLDPHHGPDLVHVVVPCHDEEALLPRCLEGLRRTREALARSHPHVAVSTTVVLDRCTDGSADVVAEHASEWDVAALVTSAGCAGAARRIGVRRGLDQRVAAGHDLDARRVWVASTDADSVVPPQWLATQVELAGRGVEMVVGTVHPDPRDLEAWRLREWRARHRLGPGHPHVHGANLGIGLAAYLAVGGFAPVPTGEDVALAAAVRRSGRRWCATAAAPVLTSGRLAARVQDGFAGYLRDLELLSDRAGTQPA